MRYIKPDFYDQFICTADQCPDTCCAGWQIMIDEDSLEKYSQVKGAFGKRLRNSIDWTEGAFFQCQKRCAFLNESNLCDLYTNLGSDALCDTCRNYPRHVEEYADLRERSLSLSCPVAAQIILSRQGFPEFVMEEDDRPDELEEEFEDFDYLLFTQLEDARNAVFDVLKGYAKAWEGKEKSQGLPVHTLQELMKHALEMAARMQECVEDGRYFEIDEVIQRCREEVMRMDVASGSEISVASVSEEYRTKDFQSMKALFEGMYGLERLREEWTDVLQETFHILYEEGEKQYTAVREAFAVYCVRYPDREALWENTGLQLFVFFVYTYFCGAVYDDRIYSKMALSVYSVIFIRELLLARWWKTQKLDMQDCIELSYRYAREVEHSDQNLDFLEDFLENFMK